MEIIQNIEEELSPLLNAKLVKIISDKCGFVLHFSNGRTFTGHRLLVVGDSKIEADLRIFCGYHGKIPKSKRIVRPLGLG